MADITHNDPVVTESKLTEFYNSIKPFLGYAVGAGGGFAPIGSINFFDAVSAPNDWLACDGSTYNIADYPQLAEWYELQHGSKNFYGGDGITTFKVPNLQGEFLRGAGTNSHTNQGNGAKVGVHQNGTRIPEIELYPETKLLSLYTDTATTVNYPLEADKMSSTSNNGKCYQIRSTNDFSVANPANLGFTVRPTNTSFLICVKAKDRGEVYSLDEQRIGTWVNGKPLYQKTFELNYVCPSKNGWEVVQNNAIHNIDVLISATTSYIYASSYRYTNATTVRVDEPSGNLTIYVTGDQMSGNTLKQITIQYTKTTDA